MGKKRETHFQSSTQTSGTVLTWNKGSCRTALILEGYSLPEKVLM